jgi:hypothetical protein
MRRLAVSLALVTALAACNRKHADPAQGFDPNASGSELPPPPTAGPGAIGAQRGQGGDDLPPAQGEMPDDDVHAGLAARGGGGGGGGGGGSGANPHAGGGMDVGGMGFQSPDPNAPIDPNKYLRGSIHPADATKDKIPPNALIYVSVKRTDPKTGDATPGMPIATLQLHAASWPLAFELNERSRMTKDADFSGDVVVTARFAQSTDPLMKAPGDIVGHVRVTIPADKLDITLDHVLTDEEIKASMAH